MSILGEIRLTNSDKEDAMKKGLLESYMAGITDETHGESYGTLLRYFFPEFITNLLLYSMPFWLDAVFIASLSSTSTYVTLGVTNNFIHLFIKIAEALSVGTLVLSGQFNGMSAYKNAGRTIRDAFWVTCIVGFMFASFLYFGAPFIYRWYGVSDDIIHLGVPFLRLRAIGVLCMFVYLALVGFLRGIKNTRTPMKIFIVGTIVFGFFDYILIFGKFGFSPLGLQGSAIATLLQYCTMTIIALGYILFNAKNRKFGIALFSVFKDVSYVKRLILLSWPVFIDKATMALAYIWLGKMIVPMGTCGVAAFCVIKDMERFAFLPAIAFAQVITFLVSNDFGTKNWEGIKSNIKKVIFLASLMVFTILLIVSLNSTLIVSIFDKKGEFTVLAARAFPLLSLLVFFDLVQLILSGALRGACNVRIVMKVRFIICLCYFVPLSYLISHWHIQNQLIKFVLIYGAFYLGNALMSIIYINRFRGERWKTPTV